MQVFLLLLDADGRVVTRNDLFDQCWGGAMVGDPSLNRAILGVRRIAMEVAPGLFEIETIPRTGYRITGEILPLLQGTDPGQDDDVAEAKVSRRVLIQTGAAAALAVGVGGLWWLRGPRFDARFDTLLKRADHAVQKLQFNQATVRILEEALAIRPQSAKAWGLLALVRVFIGQGVLSRGARNAGQSAEDAARKALSIDSREPNALLAMFELEGSTLDWLTRDRKLREIVALAPANIIALTELVAFLQATGLTRESWSWNERALKVEPLSTDLLGRRALKLWIMGRTPVADRVIDQVRSLYPGDSWAWWVQFLILSLTDRAPAAQVMLDDHGDDMLGSPMSALWRACLPALEQRSPETVAAARRACLDAAKRGGDLAAHGVMILSAIGEVSPAFAVADGFLLWRGRIVRQGQTADDAGWRVGVQWLFTPPCAIMRADPRFLPLCDGIGLTDYWKGRGVRPDYQVYG
jgi:hypothetical protein